MEKPNRVGAQVYAYTVCLVAVITFLISVGNVVSSVIDLGDPLHAGFTPQGSPSLASFENYKMDMLKAPSGEGTGGEKAAYIPDDETLRAMYNAAREDKIQRTNFNAYKSIFTFSLLILICVVLFVTHWRWMRKVTMG